MRTLLSISLLSAMVAATGCSESDTSVSTEEVTSKQSAESTMESTTSQSNILFAPSPLPYFTPEFDKITTELYEPAFAEGMKQHMAEIMAIANSAAPATFENTILAMEGSGEMLTRVSNVFYNLSGLISNPEYQRIEAAISPQLSSHYDDMVLNANLFARVKSIYEARASFPAEEQRIIELTHTSFIRAGAALTEEEKNQIRAINTEVSKLQTEFSQNVLNSFKEDVVLVTDKAELAGLSDDEIASLKAAAESADKEGYAIALVNTTRHPILTSLENRSLREKIWKASAYRLEAENAPIALRLAKLRAQKAKLLGYENWASYVVSNQMAGTPAAVFKILDDLAPKAVEKAQAEAADIQEMIAAEGKDFTLEPWDWAHYAAKVRKAKYSFDSSEIKPYFEMNRVLNDGLFYSMNKLYGISVKVRNDLPLWHEDVMSWEVFNEDGSTIGLFYLDPYAREGKRGGAWMSVYVGQNGLTGTKPVVYNALNIPKPAEGQPTLMTYDEVSTLFHEFGHAVHGLYSDVKYPSVAGTSTPRDFVEFPSQFHEDYSLDTEVMKNYAKHYETNEAIPAELLQKMLKARTFNQGFDTTEYLAAALLDMEWHSITAEEDVTDAKAFEKSALQAHGIDYAPAPPRYKTTYFSHIFAGGYSSGYYAYLWTEVLAADAFAFLQEKGGITRENGDLYRDKILSIGNSTDLMEAYTDFRGQEPSADALLVRRGLQSKYKYK